MKLSSFEIQCRVSALYLNFAQNSALYLREGLRYKVVARSKPTSIVDYLFIELRLPYPLLVCVVYNPPLINGFSIYGSELEPLISKYSDVLVLGDFNHDGLEG
jgi:hypothetical protein